MQRLDGRMRTLARAWLIASLLVMISGFESRVLCAPPKGAAASPPPAPISPDQQVHQWLQTLRNATDEDQRAKAAQALAVFDSVRYFEIIPALTEALQRDSSTEVRRACVRSLSELKPTSDEVLQALTEAAEKDGHWRVRWAARSAKKHYRVAAPQPAPLPPASSPTLKMPQLPAPELPPLSQPPASTESEKAPKGKSKWLKLDFWRKKDQEPRPEAKASAYPAGALSKPADVPLIMPILSAPRHP